MLSLKYRGGISPGREPTGYGSDVLSMASRNNTRGGSTEWKRKHLTGGRCWPGGVTGQHIEPKERSNMNEIPLEFSYNCYTCNITVRDTDYVYLVERMKAHFQNMHGKDVSFQSEPKRKDAMKLYDGFFYGSDESSRKEIKETKAKMEKLGIISSQRIGWEQKQEALEILAAISANGYLTSEEWEGRNQAVQDATTQAEIDFVFQDLTSAKKAVHFSKVVKEPKPSGSFGTTAFVIGVLCADTFALSAGIFHHEYFLIPIILICALIQIIVLKGKVKKI
jgi:hypothetical protein